MKNVTLVLKSKALVNFVCLVFAFVVATSLTACSDLAVKERSTDQMVAESGEDEKLTAMWQTLRNPAATSEQRLDALNYLNDNPGKRGVARMSFEPLTESDVRRLLKEPTYINLHEADLSGFDLSGLGFFSVDLRGVNLSKTNLSGSDFHMSDLSRVDFSGANLSGANLSSANLSEANLTNANLENAYLALAVLKGANLSGADLSRARSLNDSSLDEACGDDDTRLPVGFSIPICGVQK